jgi:hypothetical protein
MREDFIHYLWKFKKLSGQELFTTTGRRIDIVNLGTHNFHSGPDFFNGRVKINDQEWAGNIEMHLKSSDWFMHGHDDDPAYDNVILHVVWTHDAEISTRDGLYIPVLEVSQYVDERLLQSYHKLFAVKNNQFINCEKSIHTIDDFIKEQWLEKLYFERLENKSDRLQQLLDINKNDWEATFFQWLSRSFGTKINADAFEQTARSMDQATVRKLSKDAFQLESVFLGQANLLEKERDDLYYKECLTEYAFAKAKFQLQPSLTPMKFFRIRPVNYPTIRFSQLARLYHFKPLLFGEVLLAKTKKDFYKLFHIKTSKYWETHHVFDKEVKSSEKHLTENFIDLLIINCIVPIKFKHAQFTGKDITEELVGLMYELNAEKNTVVQGFKELMPVENALHSQSLLQLKPNYCDVNKCLSCDMGVRLLQD